MDNPSYHRGFAPIPDLRLRFAHGSYAVAQDAVERALRSGAGVALIIGPPGSGKSLLAADIVQRQLVDEVPVARIVADDADLLRAVARGLNLQVSRVNRATVMTTLVRYLANRRREGRTPVVVVDEAQRLAPAALGELWRMGNPRTPAGPLLQLVLAGEPTLLERLQTPQCAPLWAAVGAVGELKPLDAPQTRAYIAHRLNCSGWRGWPAVSAEALRCVHRLGAGQPARINLIMERLLSYGANLGLDALEQTDVERVAALLVDGGELPRPDPQGYCGLGLPAVGPALQPLDAGVAAEFAAVALPAVGQGGAAMPSERVIGAAAGLAHGWTALRRRIAATALRRRLGLVALIGMAFATTAVGTGSSPGLPAEPPAWQVGAAAHRATVVVLPGSGLPTVPAAVPRSLP